MGFKATFLKGFRKAIPFIARYWNHYEIRGLEHIAAPGSKVLAINHGGGWDYDNFLIMSALDHVHTTNPARKRIWLFAWDKWCDSTSGFEGIWSDLYQQYSAIPIHIEKRGKSPIPWEMVDNIVQRGELMVMCPEGHSAARYEGYRLWKFYPGVVKVHLRYRIPIIPAVHIGPTEVLPILNNKFDPNQIPPWIHEKVFPFPLPAPRKIILHLGAPIKFENYYGKTVDTAALFKLAAQVRLKVVELIALYRPGITWVHPYGKKVNSMYKRDAWTTKTGKQSVT